MSKDENVEENRQTSKFENNRFYEAERVKPKITHKDFASDENFSDYGDTSEINDFLLSKDYEEFIFVDKKNPSKRTIETISANRIFHTCYHEFKNSLDAVEIFAVIVSFYELESKDYFWKLVKKFRELLKVELSRRVSLDYYTKDERKEIEEQNVIQRSFKVPRKI